MALSIFDNLEEANDELEKIEDEIEIPHITKEEILKNYDFNFDVDVETLEFLKEQTIKVHKKGNTFYTELGKIFKETQEKLANNKTGVFRKWFESLGFTKDTTYRMISRYNHIVALCDDIKVKDFEALPLSISYEISKESCPEFIREKVLNGQIKTKSEIKKAIKEVQNSRNQVAEEIQEAEIVEEKISYTYIKTIISELTEKLKEVEFFAKENDGLSKSEYDKLQEIIKIMK